MALYAGTSTFLLLRPQLKTKILGIDGSPVEEVTLPDVFRLPVRKDLIKRAYLSEFTARLQPKGRDPLAGQRTTARSFGVGLGIARVPRIPGLGRAALINSAVGGRVAHPPRVEKRLHEEINRREKLLATASALAATSMKEFVLSRGHVVETDNLPIVIDSSIETTIHTTKQAKEFLKLIHVWNDIERAKKRTRYRAGRGKMRGRRYITPKSVLFILEKHSSPFGRAVSSLPGVDVAEPSYVNILQLAPGGVPGRLTVISANALKGIEKRFSRIFLG